MSVQCRNHYFCSPSFAFSCSFHNPAILMVVRPAVPTIAVKMFARHEINMIAWNLTKMMQSAAMNRSKEEELKCSPPGSLNIHVGNHGRGHKVAHQAAMLHPLSALGNIESTEQMKQYSSSLGSSLEKLSSSSHPAQDVDESPLHQCLMLASIFCSCNYQIT